MSQWIAYLKDNTQIKRFDEGKENSFRLVVESQDLVDKFEINNNGFGCIVDLKDGAFTLLSGGQEIPFCPLNYDNIDKDTDLKYRLVYYRREIHSFGASLELNGGTTQFVAVGWQVTTKDGRNLKRIIRVYNHGLFELED